MLVFHPVSRATYDIIRDQLLDAASNGRTDDIIALVAEGADLERTNRVRF